MPEIQNSDREKKKNHLIFSAMSVSQFEEYVYLTLHET